MVDGDATYDPKAVNELLQPVLNRDAEMVVGSRLHNCSKSEFRQLRRLGNRLFLSVLNSMFGVRLTDILSGHRVFTREFVKHIPLFTDGFQVETELTIKALERRYCIVEVRSTSARVREASFPRSAICTTESKSWS